MSNQYQQVENLKSFGKYREAGQLARVDGQDRYYGCHFGMRSTLERDREEFYAGWDEIDLAIRTGK